MVQNFAQPHDKISSVKCGPGHSLAISEKGRAYSWGEGFRGKLGLGYSASAGICPNQHFPKQITKNIYDAEQPEEERDIITHADCGQSISLILKNNGELYIWGKLELLHLRHNDFKKFSKPNRVNEKVHITNLAVGADHYLMQDEKKLLWVCGENVQGTLGTNDGKNRVVPARNAFFDKKRIIDFACGNGFSIVIAETFEMSEEQEKLYFKSGQKTSISDLGNNGRTSVKLVSSKMHVQTSKPQISQQGDEKHIPQDLRR